VNKHVMERYGYLVGISFVVRSQIIGIHDNEERYE